MPPKKAKTTLVTEDELVDAVTTRVKESMKEDMESNFSRFERALERFAGPGFTAQASADPPSQQPPAKTPPLSEPDVPIPNYQHNFIQEDNARPTAIEIPKQLVQPPQRTPSLRPQQQDLYQRMRQPAAPAASGVNNNNPAWDHSESPYCSISECRKHRPV